MTVEDTLTAASVTRDHKASGAHAASESTSLVASDPMSYRSSAIEELRNHTGRRRRMGLVVADVLSVGIGLGVGAALFGAPTAPVPGTPRLGEMVAVGLVWMVMLAIKRLYTTRCVERLAEEISRLLVAGILSLVAIIGFSYVVGAELPTRSWSVGVFSLVTMALLIERAIARQVFAQLRASGRLVRWIAVIGTDDEANALAHSIEHDPSLGYRVAGLIGRQRTDEGGDYPIIGAFDHATEAMAAQGCVGAVVSIASIDARRVNSITRELAEHDFHVALSTNLRDIDVSRMRPQGVDGEVLIYVEPAVRTGWRKHAKRVFDVVVASLALLVTLPLLIVVALLIKLDSRGPILFRQERVGRDGTIFQMLKLRTMVVDAERRKKDLAKLNEAAGPMFKMKHDPRVTRLGRILRRTSLDEFPQFWNVLRGEMSVVGPRPALPNEMLGWDGDLFKRLSVLPGITGIWQVSGRSEATFEQYRRLDLYYVDNWSLAHDLEVVAKTFWAVLVAKGAS